MKRLTKRVNGCAYGAEGTKNNLTGNYYRGVFGAIACIDKLAEYEDLEEQSIKETTWSLRMLLEKWNAFFEDIQTLCEYKELEKQGKLLKLHCAVGDTVYTISRGRIIPMKISEISILLLDGEEVMQIKCNDDVSYGSYHYLIKEIGKSVFTTKSEAENVLQEMRETAGNNPYNNSERNMQAESETVQTQLLHR